MISICKKLNIQLISKQGHQTEPELKHPKSVTIQALFYVKNTFICPVPALSLFQLSALLSVILGYKIFKEKHIKKKLPFKKRRRIKCAGRIRKQKPEQHKRKRNKRQPFIQPQGLPFFLPAGGKRIAGPFIKGWAAFDEIIAPFGGFVKQLDHTLPDF